MRQQSARMAQAYVRAWQNAGRNGAVNSRSWSYAVVRIWSRMVWSTARGHPLFTWKFQFLLPGRDLPVGECAIDPAVMAVSKVR